MTDLPPGDGSDDIITGRPVISDYDQAVTLAKQLSPDQSLARANDSAKWAVQTIALVATFLGGFGAVAGLSSSPTRHGPLIVGTIVLSGLAVGLGIVALLPRFRPVDPNKDEDVKRYFEQLLRRRGVFTIAAFVCLLAAILLAVITSLVIEHDPVVPTVSLTAGWDGSGTSPAIGATLSVSHAIAGTSVDLVVKGPGLSGSSSAPTATATLASASGTVGQNGTTEVDLKFLPTIRTGPFTVFATDTSNAPAKVLATASIGVPPVFVSPTTTATTDHTVPAPPAPSTLPPTT